MPHGAVVEVGTLPVWRAGGVAARRGGYQASRTAGPGRGLSPWGGGELREGAWEPDCGASVRGEARGPAAAWGSGALGHPPGTTARLPPRTERRAGRNAGPEPTWVPPHTHPTGRAGAPDQPRSVCRPAQGEASV